MEGENKGMNRRCQFSDAVIIYKPPAYPYHCDRREKEEKGNVTV